MKIPIRISPAFWLFSGLLSLVIAQGDFTQALIWMAIIFGSVLFHEFGHALTARLFGLHPRIELVAMGGLTYHGGERLPFWKQFLITLAGPFFGFLIVMASFYGLSYGFTSPVLKDIFSINLLWTVLNLFPVLPLDGGQLMRIVLEGIFKVKGLRYALVLSMSFAFLGCLGLFLVQNYFGGMIFFLFAFENFMGYRRSKLITESDKNDRFQEEFVRAELKMRSGDKEGALGEFEHIRAETKQGMLFVAASHYVAFLQHELGQRPQAYETLLSIKDQLDPEGQCLLHKIAFEENHFSTVIELSAAAYQAMPEAEVALRNAYACAALRQVESTIGWLQSAVQQGTENLSEIIQEQAFDAVRSDPAFRSFLKGLSHA